MSTAPRLVRIDEVHGSPRGTTSVTKRELEVLKLIADGKSTKEVAALLGITFKTSASHRFRLLQKFGVHESVSLVRAAMRQGIIEA